jgi:ketosteroid isomerase-like protein
VSKTLLFLAFCINFNPWLHCIASIHLNRSKIMRFNRTLILPMLLILMALAACSGNPQKQGPKETAEAFLTALQFGDYDKAKTYCSEGTAKNLALMETMSGLGANPMKEKFTIKDVKEEGEYATVTYDQAAETDKILQLRHDEGKWVVVMSKTDMGGPKKSDDKPDNIFDADDKKDETPPADKYKSYREGKSAQEVAEAFVKALNYKDFDAAMRYGSKSTNDMLDYQKSMSALSDDKKDNPEKTILRVTEDGDFAQAFYKEAGKKGEKVLKLGKDDNGNWEVIMSKSEMDEDE